MTRPRPLLTVAAACGTTLCAMTQLVPAFAAPVPAVTVLPAGPGNSIVMDARTGELLSITSTAPLPDAVVKQFDALPGSKAYTQDVHTGRIMSVARN
jgi:hypothetical protein